MNDEKYAIVRDAADLYQVARLIQITPDGIPVYEVAEVHAMALQRALKLVADMKEAVTLTHGHE